MAKKCCEPGERVGIELGLAGRLVKFRLLRVGVAGRPPVTA